jgi:hypothetical protein
MWSGGRRSAVAAIVGAGILALLAARLAAPPAAVAALSTAIAAARPEAFQAVAAATPGPADRSDVQFRVSGPVLLGWLQAVTPYTVTVGTPPLSTDLTFSEPGDLVLRDGQASFRVRVRGRPLPVDQVLSAAVAVRYDARQGRYALVLSSLPVQVPGLGVIDVKSYVPPLEFPAAMDDLWRSQERPYGLSLVIRRIRILEQAVEIGADARFTPNSRTAGRGGTGGRDGR